jgi:GNAT superfamily N-acetyltransferase
MELHPFTPQYLPAAADLFLQNFRRLRQSVPALPAALEDEGLMAGKISRLLEAHPGVVALEEGRLVGYLTYMVLDNFRDAGRRAAYCPEWAHATATPYQGVAYRRMYRQAAAQWAAQGCQVHAITLLADDQEALQTWFWNGFGMAVVDAVRPMTPLEREPKTLLRIRQAGAADAPALAALDVEHCRYYTQSPVFMALRESQTADEFGEFLEQPGNSAWLALDGNLPVGFLRLNGYEFDAADIVAAAEPIFINGAFLQPGYRGRGANSAMLQAALQHHARLGKTCCAVDFEAFNPDATSFWLRHFQPVCLSLMRCPEVVPPGGGQQGG